MKAASLPGFRPGGDIICRQGKTNLLESVGRPDLDDDKI